MIELIIGIILFFLVLWWDVNSDYKKVLRGEVIDHDKELFLRCLLLTPSAVFLTLYNFSLLHIPATIFMQGAWYWELFDGWLNKKRGKSWRYNGSDDSYDADTDDFLQKLSPTQQMMLKWGLIILSTTLYIL